MVVEPHGPQPVQADQKPALETSRCLLVSNTKENKMIACQLDSNGVFLGAATVDESPLEPGVFLVPAGAVMVAPPVVPEGMFAVWSGTAFLIEPIPALPVPEINTPTQADTIALYEKALDDHLDGIANLHRYRDRFTFAQRATRPGPWYAEGCAFYDWMETCNAQAFALLSEVQAGNAVMPTIDAFIDSLPEFSL